MLKKFREIKKNHPEAMVDLTNFTNKQLQEIYESVNAFEWNDLLGEKPEGFDKLPKFRRKWWYFWIERTKEDYTFPIWQMANLLLSEDSTEGDRRHLGIYKY